MSLIPLSLTFRPQFNQSLLRLTVLEVFLCKRKLACQGKYVRNSPNSASVRLDSINNPCEIYQVLSLQSQIIKPDMSIISSCGTIPLFYLRSATLPCRQQKCCSCGWLVFPMRDLKEYYQLRFNRLYKSILDFTNLRFSAQQALF